MRITRLWGMFLIFVFILFTEFGEARQNTQNSDELLKIHLKSRHIEFFRNDTLFLNFPIRVGKASRPTPLGEGYIAEKREKPIFRFVDPGPKQGKIVDSAECADGKRKVNYKVMRALSLRYTSMIPNQRIVKRLHLNEKGEDRYSIHSVTCEETIGHAISKGCIGMRIDDLLQLFPVCTAGEYGTRFLILDD